MAIVVRYVDVKEAKIRELFPTFVEVSNLDDECLTEYIIDTLKSYYLNLDSIVS